MITRSAVHVGDSETVARALALSDVNVTSNPEFLAEGSAVDDCLVSNRIVIEASSDTAARNVTGLYSPLASSRLVFTGWTSAELIKYASSAYLTIRLTFVHSIAALCESVGACIRPVLDEWAVSNAKMP